ncbi:MULTISPECIES: hypothetical protein [Streptomyces]|uniref:DNA-binding MarR family transcriptional regulator n=1 Tax=Streptomyces nymphaeiformis TaxID=2663842 RepID=A0A7W7U979_9ACTN|nr:hypothetical protein [Streptomyces nymphaeiformis]MBB4985980.1 DNA-binding MarR family transcriptional regulator [Streptomyces nymphaeiformis]
MLALTDEGRTAHRRISERVGTLRLRLMECLSPEEHTILRELLRRLAALAV